MLGDLESAKMNQEGQIAYKPHSCQPVWSPLGNGLTSPSALLSLTSELPIPLDAIVAQINRITARAPVVISRKDGENGWVGPPQAVDHFQKTASPWEPMNLFLPRVQKSYPKSPELL